MNKSRIFSHAWSLARSAKSKFGGKVKEYFAECLKISYSELKEPAEQRLLRLGFKMWENGTKRRIYINWWQFDKIFDFSVWKTSNGRFDTDSKNASKNMAGEWAREKHYFDCNTGVFESIITGHRLPVWLKD